MKIRLLQQNWILSTPSPRGLSDGEWKLILAGREPDSHPPPFLHSLGSFPKPGKPLRNREVLTFPRIYIRERGKPVHLCLLCLLSAHTERMHPDSLCTQVWECGCLWPMMGPCSCMQASGSPPFSITFWEKGGWSCRVDKVANPRELRVSPKGRVSEEDPSYSNPCFLWEWDFIVLQCSLGSLAPSPVLSTARPWPIARKYESAEKKHLVL